MHIVGSLAERIAEAIKNIQPVHEEDVGNWMVQLLQGLQCLHQHGILHMNIKPENILFATPNTIQLSDFGISPDLLSSHKPTSLRSALYSSPEALVDNNRDNAADVWSLGCVIYELCCLEVRVSQDRSFPFPVPLPLSR